MATAYINIGSNFGNRRAYLRRAVADIQTALSARARCSDVVESEPWGYESAHPYLNIGIAIEVGDIDPLRLLAVLLGIQNRIDPSPHRTPDGAYCDRRIDIDLIAIDDLVIDSPRLTLPHPRMHLRQFVLIPMKQIAPEWIHPLLHLTAAELL